LIDSLPSTRFPARHPRTAPHFLNVKPGSCYGDVAHFLFRIQSRLRERHSSGQAKTGPVRDRAESRALAHVIPLSIRPDVVSRRLDNKRSAADAATEKQPWRFERGGGRVHEVRKQNEPEVPVCSLFFWQKSEIGQKESRETYLKYDNLFFFGGS
jgi:hypothetical protein